jgi:hypothetical protein
MAVGGDVDCGLWTMPLRALADGSLRVALSSFFRASNISLKATLKQHERAVSLAAACYGVLPRCYDTATRWHVA